VREDDEGEGPDFEEEEEEEDEDDQDDRDEQDEQDGVSQPSPTPTVSILIRPAPTEAALIQNLNRIYDTADEVLRTAAVIPANDEPDTLVVIAALIGEAASIMDPNYDRSVPVTLTERLIFCRMLGERHLAHENGQADDPVWGIDRRTLLARVPELDGGAEHSGDGAGAGEVGEAGVPAPAPGPSSNEADTDAPSSNVSPAPPEGVGEEFPLTPLFRGPTGGPGAWIDDDL
jgi:hypothetical protein